MNLENRTETQEERQARIIYQTLDRHASNYHLAINDRERAKVETAVVEMLQFLVPTQEDQFLKYFKEKIGYKGE